LRSNGKVRGMLAASARGESPLTLPASRVPPERLSKGLSREGRGENKYGVSHALLTKLSITFLSPALSKSIDSLFSSTARMVP